MTQGQSMVGGSPASYRALQGWARSAVWVFYGDVEVTAAQRLPEGRPMIFAANHSNALADVAVLVAKMPQFPRFLATGTWWAHASARLRRAERA